LTERWALDGCGLVMNDQKGFISMLPSGCQTAIMACLSPTAVLHTMTGITLLTGFMHVKSLEQSVVLS